MKLAVYQQIAMELKDLRFQESLDREQGISADFSITSDLRRNLATLVRLYLPEGTEFLFKSFVSRMYFKWTPPNYCREVHYICTIEVSLAGEPTISVEKHTEDPHINDPCWREVLTQFTKALMKEVEV